MKEDQLSIWFNTNLTYKHMYLYTILIISKMYLSTCSMQKTKCTFIFNRGAYSLINSTSLGILKNSKEAMTIPVEEPKTKD